ncbi:MAG: NAD-dependent epimerase/dehydratase family protein [Pseudomonadota bacterium]
MNDNKTICIAGASGLVGANLIREALARGYTVHGTLRDTGNARKAPHLRALPGAERLTLFDADMAQSGAFDAALDGVDAVFIACLIPTYAGPDGTPAREMDDERGEREIVMPTVDGALNILRSAAAAGVKNALICSSTSSTNPTPPVALKNEVDHWSDKSVQYAAKKYTSAAKTVMERAVLEFAAEHDMRACIFLPTLMLGPAVLPLHNTEGFQAVLHKMVNGEPPRHTRIPNDSNSIIHVQDLARLFFAAYENPSAQGRYFGVYDSWHWADIYAELAKLIPDLQMPEPLSERALPATGFDFTRRDSLGVTLRDIPTILAETVAYLRTV